MATPARIRAAHDGDGSESLFNVSPADAGDLMRLSRNKKAQAPWDRKDELRKGRAAAETLRVVHPNAASVSVELSFHADSQPSLAPQSFSLYPPAKAHFIYACPYGDCDGVYDLQSAALRALQAEEVSATGTLKCTGHRSRDGMTARPCDLNVVFSITAHYNDA